MIQSFKFIVKDVQGEDVEYNGLYLPAIKAIKMKARILKVLAPVLSGGLKGEDDILKGIASIVQNMDEDDVLNIITDLVYPLQRKGSDLSNEKNFNDAYAQNLMELYKAFFEVLKINYKDILGGKLEGITEKLTKVL